MNKELILEILNYIEVMEEIHDELKGTARSFSEIEDDGNVPDLYYRLKKII